MNIGMVLVYLSTHYAAAHCCTGNYEHAADCVHDNCTAIRCSWNEWLAWPVHSARTLRSSARQVPQHAADCVTITVQPQIKDVQLE
jgi:hypothetical protein